MRKWFYVPWQRERGRERSKRKKNRKSFIVKEQQACHELKYVQLIHAGILMSCH